MKIKLIRSGGFIPVTKAAEADVEITAQELDRLIEKIKPDDSEQKIKDRQYYRLAVGSMNTSIDLNKVPEEYKEIFSKLKNDLKPLKT